VTAVGEFQGTLSNGSWTRSIEEVEWTIPKVSYEGNPDVAPPSMYVLLSILSDASVHWSGNPIFNSTTKATAMRPLAVIA